jgi:hypothetical protein
MMSWHKQGFERQLGGVARILRKHSITDGQSLRLTAQLGDKSEYTIIVVSNLVSADILSYVRRTIGAHPFVPTWFRDFVRDKETVSAGSSNA